MGDGCGLRNVYVNFFDDYFRLNDFCWWNIHFGGDRDRLELFARLGHLLYYRLDNRFSGSLGRLLFLDRGGLSRYRVKCYLVCHPPVAVGGKLR